MSFRTRDQSYSPTQTLLDFTKCSLDGILSFSIPPSPRLLILLWTISFQTFIGASKRFLVMSSSFIIPRGPKCTMDDIVPSLGK